jgi:outer membrane protein assembly factor BamE
MSVFTDAESRSFFFCLVHSRFPLPASKSMIMISRRYFTAVGLAVLLAACSGVPLLSPYRIDVQQGNLVTQEMVSTLKLGMSREQVKFVLGTPLLTDLFHADRWDYVYRLERGSGGVEQRRLAVFFDKDLLKRVDGDIVAQGMPAAAVPLAPKEAGQPAGEEKGFLDKLRDWLRF